MEFNHISVMLDECIEGLDIKPDGIYADGTLGGGGHSGEIAKRAVNGRLIAIDKDTDALEFSKKKLAEYANITYVHDDFKNINAILDGLNIDKIDGMMMDLGVSSYQIDTAERGFSYIKDAPLDMRMDKSQTLDAKQVVNSYGEGELCRLIKNYGDERFAKNIAANIARERQINAISTTGELAKIIEGSIPAAYRWKNGNPCKRTFQAIRIEVNGELTGLSQAVRDIAGRLKKGGRLVVLTFHSEEDRMVAGAMRELANGSDYDRSMPPPADAVLPTVKFINKKTQPTPAEQQSNPRSKSAKLRIIEKL